MVSGYPPRPSGGQHADEPAQPVQLQLLLSKVDLMAVQPTSQRHCNIDFKISFPCHWVRQLESHRKMVSCLAFKVYLCSLMIESPFKAIWGFEATIYSMFCTFEPFYGLEPFALLGCRWFHCLFEEHLSHSAPLGLLPGVSRCHLCKPHKIPFRMLS